MLQERHLTDHVQLRLLTSGCGCWRLPARSTVASPAVLFFSRNAQKSEEPRACLPSASHRQALARGRGSSSAPAVAAWLCTQPHVACLALQASPERGGSKEQRVAYERAGMASAQITYKRCAYSAHHAHHRVYFTVRAHPGLTARHVIYRRAAGRLGDQMSSPDDYLPVRVGPAFRIAPCGEL